MALIKTIVGNFLLDKLLASDKPRKVLHLTNFRTAKSSLKGSFIKPFSETKPRYYTAEVRIKDRII